MVASVGFIGLGFVGGAIKASMAAKGCTVYGHDLYKQSDSFEQVCECPIVFLCLPTQYDDALSAYDKSALVSTCQRLSEAKYAGLALIKCTVEPGTTASLKECFPSLRLLHNPEFLSAATAQEDVDNQKHVVLGAPPESREGDLAEAAEVYTSYYPGVRVSKCTAIESESMKIFANSFYAVKIQFFNEMYAMCQKTGADYNKVRDMIVANGWLCPMHTEVPGTDGKLSYGGLCFPKDTSALLEHMRRLGTPHAVLEATVSERGEMRTDRLNMVGRKA